MSDKDWYVYQQAQQLGPFDQEQLGQLIDSNMIAQDAYLFKIGWKDWRAIEECAPEIGRPGLAKPITRIRRDRAPRATIRGRVIVHNNGQLVIGSGVNISATGLFVETADTIFQIGESIKLTCRVEGINKAFNVSAKVMRYNGDKRFPVGYGMQFENLEEKLAIEIQKLIDQVNRGRAEAGA